MKGIIISLFVVGCLAITQAQSLVIEFESPQDFRDFRLNSLTEERTARVFEREVTRALDSTVERFVGEGRLHLTFTDIDLAGEIQPWRTRTGQDIRFVETLFPPRLDFRYVVKDANGEVVLEGETSQRDLAFMHRLGAGRSGSSFFFETQLLRDWIRRELQSHLGESL
ncbi:MAG: DUF3016 domain-containing protein [Opitutales bacterium]|nr:DUF3016 domain-containing protein [Opitutales bacterium]